MYLSGRGKRSSPVGANGSDSALEDADPSGVSVPVTVGRLIGGIACSSANAGVGSKSHMHTTIKTIIAHLP
jgi:hypothetical protein